MLTGKNREFSNFLFQINSELGKLCFIPDLENSACYFRRAGLPATDFAVSIALS